MSITRARSSWSLSPSLPPRNGLGLPQLWMPTGATAMETTASADTLPALPGWTAWAGTST